MQASVVTRYGGPDVVELRDVPLPRIGARDVLVRVVATSVSSGDARIRAARFPRGFGLVGRLAFGLKRPRRGVLGGAFSGVVTAVGSRVENVAVGDEVCGMTGARLGTHAEFVAARAAKVVALPAGVSHDDAAGLLFGGSAARHFLIDKAQIRPGATVLVIGASGAIGTIAVQLAHHHGAVVTAVTSGTNAALVTGLGASRVVDHTTTDVTTIGERFDVVFDTVGALTVSANRALLAPGGVALIAVAPLADMLRPRTNVVTGNAPERADAFSDLLTRVANGTLRVVVDQTLPLSATVAAHQRVDSGRKVGALIVRVG